MKCDICKKNIEQIFLRKAVGTAIKDAKGKKHWICFECQRRYKNDKQEMLKNI